MRQRLSQALIEKSGNRITEGRIDFDVSPDALGGVELRAGGNRIGWSIKDYLSSLDRFVSNAIDRESGM